MNLVPWNGSAKGNTMASKQNKRVQVWKAPEAREALRMAAELARLTLENAALRKELGLV